METKIAVLGDIHANIDALNAVLEDARRNEVTDFVCVGDVVGYNATPCECVNIVRDLGCLTVRGNHDHYCSYAESLDDFQPMAASVIEWTRRQLDEEQLRWLQSLPMSAMGTGFMLVHGTMDMPERWGYVFDTFDAEAHFQYQKVMLCFHGHTHVPLIFEKHGNAPAVHRAPQPITVQFGHKYFINTGSVGQPRDSDPRASYVTYTPKTRLVEFHRVPYDVPAAQARIRNARLPERLAQRLAVGH